MDLRELKIQFLHAKVVTDDIKVMFRTPDCYTYYVCNSHIANYNDDNVLIIDLVDKIKPIFNSGDKVTNKMFPEDGYTIKEVNEEEQYYSYKEINGKTYFKDQDKLMLVKADSSKPPVEDKPKLASTVKINPNIVPVETIRTNKFIYDEYTLFVQEMMCAIKVAASQGHNKLHFDIGEKDISVFQLGQDFTNAGYKVSAVIGNNKNSTLDIEW